MDRSTDRQGPASTLGLYLHIPFCRSKCDYCDFYSLPAGEDRMDDYLRALLRQLEEAAPGAAGHSVDTVYVGGGTPTVFGGERLAALLAAVGRLYRLAPGAEITCEANPDSAGEELLRALRRAGFGRLSLGMQSADAGELAAVHRRHTPEQTDAAVAAARRVGFENLSLDLICGLPGQTEESWRRTVEHALSLRPEHLSCYGLKVEEGTPLARRVAAGEELPDDDAQADRYLWTVERLARAGFWQYEISNFARPGYESRHNLRYWRLEPYLGFGPGAHSDFGGRRFAVPADLAGYLAGEAVLEGEAVSPWERGNEYLMLGLRTAAGIAGEEYRRRFGGDFAPLEELLSRFAGHGWAERNGDRWRLTPAGFLVSNRLIGALLEAREGAEGPGT